MFWKIASSDKNILKAGSCIDAKFYYEMLSSKNFLATHVLLNNKFVLKLYGFFFFYFWVCKNYIPQARVCLKNNSVQVEVKSFPNKTVFLQ